MAAAWTGSQPITSPGDALAALRRVTAGKAPTTTGSLAYAVRPATDGDLGTPDTTRLLPAPPGVQSLLPWAGLRRGATVAVAGSTSVLLLLLAAGMRDGAWACVAGLPALGALAADEAGIPLDRLGLVPEPGPDWPSIVAALIDGVDLVAIQAPGPVTSTIAGRLAARARQRGTVLLPILGPDDTWPGADVTLRRTSSQWAGLGHGRGRLRRQVMTLQSDGRGRSARPRNTTITWPAVPDLPATIPPPAAPRTKTTPRLAADPWANLQPSPPPADLWAAAKHQPAAHSCKASTAGTTESVTNRM
ncbi:hypothetical protein AB0G04_40745 [Actinoplanes sp. NPDC023801]|uniref:hypothetical protein n=1 Tax=Actinoplanes sp. NPDC023801 TaxID=3154595 RepID=UPI0033E3C8C5